MRRLLPVLLLFSVAALAQEDKPKKESKLQKRRDAVSEWMMGYYRKPEPEKLAWAVRELVDTGTWTASRRLPSIGFMSAALAASPDRIEAVLAVASDMKPPLRLAIYQSVWLSRAPKSLDALRKIDDEELRTGLDHMLKTAAPVPNKVELFGPTGLDFLWGAFFASGDGKYVLQIASVLAWGEERLKFPDLKMTRGAARWSLGSLAKQQKPVYEILKEHLPKASDSAKADLTEIVETAAKKWEKKEEDAKPGK